MTMGGFSLGELSGILQLDDSQYHQALADSAAASALFSVKVNDINDSVQNLDKELRTAGFDLKEVQGYLNSLRQQGLTTDEAVNTLTNSISRLQIELGKLRNTNVKLPFEDRQQTASSRGEVTEPFAKQLASLTARANTEKRFDDDAAKRQTEMFQRTVSQALEIERVEKQTVASRVKIEEDATARQRELFSQVQGDVMAQERFANEAEQRRLASIRAAQAQERAQFIEHRRQMQIASAATTVGIAAAAVGGAGIGAGLFVAKDAAEFQDAMAKSLAVIGDLSDAMRDRLAKAARDAAKETGLAAKDIAADYAIAAKGGLDAAQSLELIPKVARFAVATNSELHESTKQIITIMEALQLPASSSSKVMDELTVANQLARGSVDQLATSLEGKAGAALRSAHVSLSEALALTIAFSKAGVTASQSQTFLTQIIERLTYAARQYGNEQVQVGDKVMKFYDIVYLADGSVRPFLQTLKLLDTAFQGRSANAIGKFFDDIHLGSARGAQGLKIVLSMSDILEVLNGKLNETGNSLTSTFDQQMQSPLRQLAVLKAQLTDIAITLGIPMVAALQSVVTAMKPMLDTVASLAAKFAELPQPMQTAIAMCLGVGSASLLAGGGLLVLIGQVVRLTADLQLLQASGALGGLVSSLATVGGAAVAVTGTILGLIAAVGTYNKVKSGEFTIGSNGMPGPNPYYVPKTPETKKEAAKEGDTAGKSFMDNFRKQLEDLKRVVSDSMAGDFAVNPEAQLKKALKIEDVRQKFSEFSDQYAQVVDKLSNQQQEVISAGMSRVNALMGKGADPRIALFAMKSLEDDLKRFKADAAAKDKAESVEIAKENAADQVKAFKDRYIEDLRAFTPEVRDVMDSVMASLDKSLAEGDVKRASQALKEAAELYRLFQKTVDDTAKVQRNLTDSFNRTDNKERKNEKQKPSFISLFDRIDPSIAQSAQSFSGLVTKGTQVELAMKRLGVTSEFSLDLASKAAAGLYHELLTLKPSTDEAREAWLSARSAFIRADEGLKPLHDDFVRVREELDRIKSQGDISDRIIDLTNLQIRTKALDWATNGLGNTYRDLWKTFESSFGQIGGVIVDSVIDIDNWKKHWIDAAKSIAKSIATDIVGSLLKIGVSKVLIAVGIGSDPAKVQQTQTNASITALAEQVRLNADVTASNTASEDTNTSALDRLTNAINDLISNGGIGGSANGLPFFGAITGLAQLASGGAGGGGWMPSHDTGGYMSATHVAKVHAGEYIMTPKLTTGLTDMINNGGNGSSFDFSGAHFGPSLTPADMRGIMTELLGKLRRVGTKTKTGKL